MKKIMLFGIVLVLLATQVEGGTQEDLQGKLLHCFPFDSNMTDIVTGVDFLTREGAVQINHTSLVGAAAGNGSLWMTGADGFEFQGGANSVMGVRGITFFVQNAAGGVEYFYDTRPNGASYIHTNGDITVNLEGGGLEQASMWFNGTQKDAYTNTGWNFALVDGAEFSDTFHFGIRNNEASNLVGRFDELMVFDLSAGNFTAAEIVWLNNSGVGRNCTELIAQPDTTAPTITIEHPINNTHYNLRSNVSWINVSCNENCTVWINDSRWLENSNNGSYYYFYNDTVADLPNGRFDINVSANDTTGNYDSFIFEFYLDTTNPIAISGLSNNLTITNGSMEFSINYTDNILLWSYNISLDDTLLADIWGINETWYIANQTLQIKDNVTAGKHNISTTVCDAHTANEISIMNVEQSKDQISFNDLYVKSLISSKDTSFTKEKDRYSFSFIYDKERTEVEFEVPETCTYVNRNNYKGWFVCDGNYWLDFESPYTVEVDANRVKVSSINPRKTFSFSSIGQLNCVENIYGFYKFNSTKTYTESIIESSSQTYTLVIDTGGANLDGNATLYLNNTPYGLAKTINTNNITFTNSSIFIPFTWTTDREINVSKDNYITYQINGTYYNSTTDKQYIYRIYVNNCSMNTTTYAINFTFLNNSDDTQILIAYESTFDVWYRNPDYLRNYSFDNYTSISNTSICIYPKFVDYYVDATILYSLGSTTFNYNLDNYSLDNVTDEINLYTTDRTSLVTFTVLDQDDDEVENVLIYVMAYDVGSNSYDTVEILQTDYQGIALGNIVLNTQPYKFMLYLDGALVFESTNTYMTGTARTFRINTREDYFINYGVSRGITSSLTFNNATKTFTYTYADGTGAIHYGCLRVIKRSPNGDTLINDTCVKSSASSILVTLGSDAEIGSNTFIATGYIKFDEEFITDTLSQFFDLTWMTYDDEGLFVSFLLTTTLVTVAIFNSAVAIMLMIVAFILTNVLGIYHLNWTYLVTFVILGGIAIFKLSKSK
jgi:hypothetical protein